jgi:ubiquinone/menaquinone biosynthesis C-methylase UbiE
VSNIDFVSSVHKRTQRDYLARVNAFPKAEAARRAKQWSFDYWDGSRDTGYGGYRYDGRWRKVAELMAQHYGLKPGDTILDVGCGKGFLLYDFTQVVPGVEVTGLDISEYALTHAKEEVKDRLRVGNARKLPFADASFDLVFSINTLHNLPCFDMESALREMQRVGRKNRYLCVESYRNDEEKVNLLYWQLTCNCFFSPEEWLWWFDRAGYQGDYSFIYFE